MDPTHTQGFYMESLDYFDPDRRYGQAYSYSDRKWRIMKKSRDHGGLAFVLQPRKGPSTKEKFLGVAGKALEGAFANV